MVEKLTYSRTKPAVTCWFLQWPSGAFTIAAQNLKSIFKFFFNKNQYIEIKYLFVRKFFFTFKI